MKLFIFHAITPAGQRIDAGVFSDADIERTRDVFEAALHEEHPDAVIVSYHEHEADEADERPVTRREPLAIESMVMLGLGLVAAILSLAHYLSRRQQ